MTGTGTQADPYIPTTLTEFITAVGTSGAYVALTHDINAADDPSYPGMLYNQITWRAAQLDGANFVVYGVSVYQATVIVTKSAAVIQNVTFRDFCLKKGSTNKILIDGYEGLVTLKNAYVSCKIDCEVGSTAYLTYNCIFEDCAIDISYTGECSPNSNSDSVFDLTTFTRTTVSVANLNTAKSTRFLGYCTVYQSAFILRSPYAVLQLTYQPKQTSYSYIALLGEIDTSRAISAGAAATSCLIATQPDTSVSLTSGWTRATLDQMQDQDWLTSVGFLP